MQFKDWMDFALYDSGTGYYATNLDASKDYITAPNFGPYLGWALGREIVRSWKAFPNLVAPGAFSLVEVGCGATAGLTASVLRQVQAEAPELFAKTQAILVDRSAARLQSAVTRLDALYPGKAFACPDFMQIPKVNGFIFSNELIDAMAVHIIRKSAQGGVGSAYIEVDEQNKRTVRWHACDDPVIASYGHDIPEGVSYALNTDALDFLQTAADRLEHGFLITIDFGDMRPELFHRSAVKAFLQHRVKDVDFDKPGSEDIASPVDFTLLMDHGARVGLETMHYETLGSFLLRNGAQELFNKMSNVSAMNENLRLKTLIHPFGFGEDFKVLIQGK